MIPKEVKQLCQKCKGTGVSNKPLVNAAGQNVLVEPYTKGDAMRPQMENCRVCGGEGRVLQPLPQVIMQDGEEVKLTPEEARERYAVSA